MVDAATGKRITNAMAMKVTRARGEVVFQPATVPGKYYVYYMPSKLAGSNFTQGERLQLPTDTADGAWRTRNGLTSDAMESGQWPSCPGRTGRV